MEAHLPIKSELHTSTPSSLYCSELPQIQHTILIIQKNFGTRPVPIFIPESSKCCRLLMYTNFAADAKIVQKAQKGEKGGGFYFPISAAQVQLFTEVIPPLVGRL